jgi:hypothetical protein
MTSPSSNAGESSHYTDARRWSYISDAWIFASSWDDKEEIAMLRFRVKELESLPSPSVPVVHGEGGEQPKNHSFNLGSSGDGPESLSEATTQPDAWRAVVDALSFACPDWTRAGASGIEAATNTILRLAREAAVPRFQMHPCGLWVGQKVRAKEDLVNDLTEEGLGRSVYARRNDVLVVRDFTGWPSINFVKVSHEGVTDRSFTAAYSEVEPMPDSPLSGAKQPCEQEKVSSPMSASTRSGEKQ